MSLSHFGICISAPNFILKELNKQRKAFKLFFSALNKLKVYEIYKCNVNVMTKELFFLLDIFTFVLESRRAVFNEFQNQVR